VDSPKIVARTTEYENRWLRVVAKTVVGMPGADGPLTFYGIHPADYVTVLPILDDGRIVCVRQFRPLVEAETLELPSGHIDPGHTPDEAAHQELIEETGYRAAHLSPLAIVVPDVGRLANRQWGFVATGLARDPDAEIEAGISVQLLTPAELAERILDGAFNHALHLALVAQAICRGVLALPT
jgi:ADP-ribose pyrophosphatase